MNFWSEATLKKIIFLKLWGSVNFLTESHGVRSVTHKKKTFFIVGAL